MEHCQELPRCPAYIIIRLQQLFLFLTASCLFSVAWQKELRDEARKINQQTTMFFICRSTLRQTDFGFLSLRGLVVSLFCVHARNLVA